MTTALTLTVAVIVATANANIVRPLREIGHVKATSSFCAAFSAGAAPAARAVLAYENRLVLTLSDLAHFDASDPLAKNRGIGLLEDDLRALADSAQEGRGELASLRATAAAWGNESDRAVVEFADALDGAKGRQMELARRVSALVGTLAERPTYSIVNGPNDDHSGDPFLSRLTASRSALIDGTASSDAIESAFFTAPGDDAIGRDLARAVDRATVLENLEGCT
jgi:hypothetical protein